MPLGDEPLRQVWHVFQPPVAKVLVHHGVVSDVKGLRVLCDVGEFIRAALGVGAEVHVLHLIHAQIYKFRVNQFRLLSNFAA